jgi:hypothetical protein
MNRATSFASQRRESSAALAGDDGSAPVVAVIVFMLHPS